MLKLYSIIVPIALLTARSSTAFTFSSTPRPSSNPRPFSLSLSPAGPTIRPFLTLLKAVNNEDDDSSSSTIATVSSPSGSQTITLIGTAHLSQKSNEQVISVLQRIQPQVVMVELDESRLQRIGIENLQDIQVDRVVTADDIMVEKKDSNNSASDNNKNNPLVSWIQNALADSFSKAARGFLTNMYDSMSDKVNTYNNNGDINSDQEDIVAGGEFLAALRAAEQCDQCHTLVLGDRSSIETIKRAAILALQSGNPWRVLSKLNQVNEEELSKLADKVKSQMLEDNDNDDTDDGQFQVAMMEALKTDTELRERLFSRLEQEVPEFTQAFLKERDFIMAESIRRELVRDGGDVTNVVGVVGLAHVPGMIQHLEKMLAATEESIDDAKPLQSVA